METLTVDNVGVLVEKSTNPNGTSLFWALVRLEPKEEWSILPRPSHVPSYPPLAVPWQVELGTSTHSVRMRSTARPDTE